MARSIPGARKPRVRASAPTLRERQEAVAKDKAEPKPPSKLRKGLGKMTVPFRRLRLRDRSFVKALGRVLRPLGWVLRLIAPRYLINSWRELRKVIWPSRRETWRLTLAVFIFAIIFGAMVAGVDKGLDDLFKKVILK